MSSSSPSLRTVDMSFLSNATSYVDDRGAGHVKVNNSKDWSEILPNNTTARIVYEGSGSAEEVLIIPSGVAALDATKSSSGSQAESSHTSIVDNPHTDSSCDNCSGNSIQEIDKGSTPTMLLVVGIILVTITIATIFAVVRYNRRNRRRISDDPDIPFIVSSLTHQAPPQLSTLDTDIRPDLWVEGQYQYSPTMSGLENSLSGTAILSDNNTIASRHRLTVDAYPISSDTRGGLRYHTRLNKNERVRYDKASSDGVSSRRRNRRETSPVVLYEQDSIEERKTSSGQKIYQKRRSSQRQRQQSPRLRHTRQQESQHQRRRDMYAARREM
ncbi:uncharacterized protein PHALS_07328 [Plasmopara halstedii]|uniref:Uncharacterized protein n=1 Tax=Plasmopara halstedii TaxID=4781 RepID=A0A0P1B5R7_PLAHL|nr:uncharacterized protein PHALS_07328 [Plasmopara halstedii]CEG49570.1 hypothetical protein PHALS_07328 [Plasmopara halstedii]|eukprot:XP_024585939.1 hypothetical protein PHALS_07328 [Plasmopara halstedii]